MGVGPQKSYPRRPEARPRGSRAFHAWIRAFGVACALGSGPASVGCAQEPKGSPGDPPYLTIFLIDGLSESVFEEELAAQRLPNLARLQAEGMRVEGGISAFPSMTGYAYYPFLTAHDAAVSGIQGLRWLDRTRAQGAVRNYVGRTNVHMNRDLRPSPLTLYEHIEPAHSWAINALVDRGVHSHVVHGASFTFAKYRDHWWLARGLAALPGIGRRVPDLFEAERQVLVAAEQDLKKRPKIQWVTFTSPDAYHHIYGFDDGYRRLLHHLDALIGQYRVRSASLGLEKQRIYAVLSDHGLADVEVNLDLSEALNQAGVSTFREPATYVWSSDLDATVGTETQAVLLVNGNTMNYLYFRDPTSGRFDEPLPRSVLQAYPTKKGPVDVVRLLSERPGVEHLIMRAQASTVVVQGRNGWGIIRGSPAGWSYEYQGSDPLGYADQKAARFLLDGKAHSDQEWLVATQDSQFPYAVPRLGALFASSRTGDLVVTAEKGFDLAADYELFVQNYRGGHGGLRADQLRVPYILSGPGIPRGARVLVARAEDVGATLFHALGLASSPGAAGRSLLSAAPDPVR